MLNGMLAMEIITPTANIIVYLFIVLISL